MSFVLLEEDDSTVQEALAMIDACDEMPIMGDLPDARDSIAKDPNRVKRSRQEQNRERDFRRRQRQKEERLQLQMQAQRLEMYLSQLRESGGGGASFESLRDSTGVTSDLQQQRVEAELLNSSLRKAVTAEVKWSKSLLSVLNKRQTMETVSLTSSMLSSSQSKPSSIMYRNPAALRDDPAAQRRYRSCHVIIILSTRAAVVDVLHAGHRRAKLKSAQDAGEENLHGRGN
ncbi:uncharacterized protein IUM83_01066 [Phytophthora cinnamomi]|uniref:uncharacterized protein n=1 Tax=Phytophthora cinnamomi TaxID=4785 RepID=UPI003559442F|nr:hypothetical protein IUM83_01066 [Phytophthora cinnamomi]